MDTHQHLDALGLGHGNHMMAPGGARETYTLVIQVLSLSPIFASLLAQSMSLCTTSVYNSF